MAWLPGLEGRRESAKGALQRLHETVFAARLGPPTTPAGTYAWGQYASSKDEHKQVGVYGTASAIRVLRATQRDRDVSPPQAWLREKWNVPGDDSEFDATVLYKRWAWHVGLVPETMLPVSTAGDVPPRGTAEPEVPGTLWKQQSAGGWAEQTIPGVPGETKLLSSALALSTLARYRDIRDTVEFRDAIIKLCEVAKREHGEYQASRGGRSREESIVQLSLALLAVARYRIGMENLVPNIVKKDEQKLAKLLEALVRSREPDFHENLTHLYVTTRPKITNRYLIFPVHPIAALALIEAGRLAHNYGYISKAAEYYTAEIKREGIFKSRSTRRASMVDQAWIAEFLTAFCTSPTTSIGWAAWDWLRRVRHHWGPWMFMLLVLAIPAAIMQFAATDPNGAFYVPLRIGVLALTLLAGIVGREAFAAWQKR